MKVKNNDAVEFGRRLSPVPFKGFENLARLNASNHKAVFRSLKYMAQNYTRPIQLGDVVVASRMSRRGFMKAFSRHVGDTPGSFMRQARIKFAKQLLIEQDLPLKAIAKIIGFRSENTFCIAFSRATGMAPKKFQRHAWLAAYRTAGFGPVSKSNKSSNQLETDEFREHPPTQYRVRHQPRRNPFHD